MVRDVIDLAWEALRLRRLKALLLTSAAPEGLTELLTPAIDRVERIDRMIMLAEARRAAALQEIERHRASLAQGLRRALAAEEAGDVDVVEDAVPADCDRAIRGTRDH